MNGRVLVFDDDELVLAATRGLLGQLGLEAVTCLDRAEGVRVFVDDPHGFVAIIMDVVMPGMSVTDALAHLRRARPDVPILLASGYDASEVRRRIRPEALGTFLPKPFTPELLRAALEAICAETVEPH